MNEIKSTLDLVMERTRNLTLSEEEKRQQATAEFRQSLNGLLQRYQDGLLILDNFHSELCRLKDTHGVAGAEIVIEEIGKRIDPDGDNQPLLALLSRFCGTKAQGIVSLLADYRSKVQSVSENRLAALKAELADKRGISGSSVLPNLDADKGWAAEKRVASDVFHKKLTEESALLGACAIL